MEVTLQQEEMRMVRRMCNIEGVPSRVERETTNR